MKKTLFGFLVGVMLTLSVTAFAETNGVNLVIDGVDVTSTLLAPPMIVNGTTLVPIRVVTEHFGAEVNWEPDTATVVIDSPKASASSPSQQLPAGSNTNSNTGSTGSTGNTLSGVPAVYEVTSDKTGYDVDESASIKVTTNRATTMVRITTSSGTVLAESSDYDQDTQGNYFNMTLPLEEEGQLDLRVQGGNDSGYSSAAKTLTVVVRAEDPDITISSALPEDSTVDEGDEVTVIVKTGTNVNKVTVFDDDDDDVVSKTTPTTKGSTTYTWELSFDADNLDGKYTYSVEAYDENDDSVSKTFSFTVDEGSSTSGDEEIISVEEDNGDDLEYENYDDGEEVTVVIYTSDDIEEVRIFDEEDDDYDDLVGTDSSPTKDGDELVWEIDIDVDDHNGNSSTQYAVYAYTDGNDDDEDWVDFYDFDIHFD